VKVWEEERWNMMIGWTNSRDGKAIREEGRRQRKLRKLFCSSSLMAHALVGP
jgi:hypothetical protein